MPVPASHIALVRAFNRDYTRRIGVLQESLHGSPYSLTEVRVLYELAHRHDVTAAELAVDLGLDRGYLSRVLKRFTGSKIIAQAPSASDGRRRHLSLTAAGKRCFEALDGKSQEQVGQMLAELDEPRRQSVLVGIQTIQDAFAPADAHPEITLRSHRPGDMGWVIERHAKIYFDEYGWDESFEALVAQIAAGFITNIQPGRERCWIAERAGQRVGSIFLVAQDESTAKLRLLLVDPDARGVGIGRLLVRECVQFARVAGYAKVALWTQQSLLAARHLYAEAGFTVVKEEPHSSFGHALIAETWELAL